MCREKERKGKGSKSMIVETMNRMARGLDYPSLVGHPGSGISISGDLEAPGTQTQNDSYGMAGGLGAVFDDVMSLNFAALPGDFVTGLNPATFDIGSYVLLGGLFLVLGGGSLFGGGRRAARQRSRKAKLVGQIAQDKALL